MSLPPLARKALAEWDGRRKLSKVANHPKRSQIELDLLQGKLSLRAIVAKYSLVGDNRNQKSAEVMLSRYKNKTLPVLTAAIRESKSQGHVDEVMEHIGWGFLEAVDGVRMAKTRRRKLVTKDGTLVVAPDGEPVEVDDPDLANMSKLLTNALDATKFQAELEGRVGAKAAPPAAQILQVIQFPKLPGVMDMPAQFMQTEVRQLGEPPIMDAALDDSEETA